MFKGIKGCITAATNKYHNHYSNEQSPTENFNFTVPKL
jgi:hypothetical protein